MQAQLEYQDTLWIRCKTMMKHGAIPIETFDKLTRKRILRLIKLQEQILEEQNKQMEKEKKQMEKGMKF